MIRIFAIVTIFATSAWAQSQNPSTNYQPLFQVKEFFQLTDSQLNAILTKNDEFNRWSGGKQSRIWQVQTDIVDEGTSICFSPHLRICRQPSWCSI